MKYICTFCNIFVLDTEKGDTVGKLSPGTGLEDIGEDWVCPVCGQKKHFLKEISDDEFGEKKAGYDKLYPPAAESGDDKTQKPALEKTRDVVKDVMYYRDEARKILAGLCAVNKVCDGNPDRVCMGMKYGRAIGFGGAGQGLTFDANFRALERYKLRMLVVKAHKEPDMKSSFLGKDIPMPVLVSSISGVKISMNDAMPEKDFQKGMLEGAKLSGTIGLSGNTVEHPEHPGVDVIRELGGLGIPVFKPQAQDKLIRLFQKAEQAGALAVGVDLDGFGSTNWAMRGKPVFRKSESELKELVDCTGKPVIFKGIMSLEDAGKVVDSGAMAMDVSNHGGRVLDSGQGVGDVLPDIADQFSGKITIMADGAVRTGYDVLKVMALGADVVLLGRPLARMVLGGGAEAVKAYLDYVKGDLRLAMLMTGCDTLKEVNRDILVKAP